ncbi:sporulation protein [Variovorax humicola]|uniref:Sporulation protein n=1 Tax=Variovorax humicola TaxID=1769758 RepID=A0ABU8VXK4_9BURK
MKTLRVLLAMLVVANLGYFAWTKGALAVFGTVPAAISEREPHRIAQQIRPDALQILKEPPAARVSAPPPDPSAAAAEAETR